MQKLANVLIPLPKKIEQGEASYTVAGFEGKIALRISEKCDLTKSAHEVIAKRLADLAAVTVDGKRGDYKVTVKVDPADPAFAKIDKGEAYYVKTGKRETVLCGKDPAGAFYAAVTFADMLEQSGDDVVVADAYVLDWPDFKHRGHTMESRYGTEFMTKQDYFDALDYLASMKVNLFIVNLYDCWGFQYDGDYVEYLYAPIPGHPEIRTPKRIKYFSVRNNKWISKKDLIPDMYKEDFFAEVVAYGKRKNIVVVPEVNSLGHNTLIPRMLPEISAKNEDGTPKNRGYCTSNPETYKFLFTWLDDVIDRYVLPFGNDELHLGLDEVGEAYKCQCPKCRDLSRTDIFLDHAIALIKHAKDKGMKSVSICHDMFLELGAVTDANKQKFVDAGIDDVTVLDWWTYEDPTAGLFFGKADQVRPILRSRIKPYSSYQNWTAAQDCYENIRGTIKVAKEQSFEGTDAYGTLDPSFDKNYKLLADVSWNVSELDNVEGFEMRYAEKYYPKNRERAATAFRALRDIMIDEAHNNYQNRTTRWLEVYPYCYRVQKKDDEGNVILDESGKPLLGLKNFPGDTFGRLIRSDRVDVAYLELLKKNSDLAISFFENSGRYDSFNDTWLLTARHYNRIADEYLSVLAAAAEYDEGGCPVSFVHELERLIGERERLMAFAEVVKPRSNSYTYLRNMSHFRQYLIDLRDYFLAEMKNGARPKLDLTNLDYAMSDRFFFLR